MNIERFDIGEKVIFAFPVGDYTDIFSMTGNIVKLDEDKRVYFVKLDEPDLLRDPDRWKTSDGYLIPMGFDTVLSVNEIFEEDHKWLNKGKDLLEHSNSFFGLYNVINTIIESLEGEFCNVAIQTLSRLDISWMDDPSVEETLLRIKELFSDQLISISVATQKLNEFNKVIKQKHIMLN